jgi:hypothetical protein
MPLTERPVPENTILGVLCVDDAITKPIPTIGCMVGGVFGYASVGSIPLRLLSKTWDLVHQVLVLIVSIPRGITSRQTVAGLPH